MLEQKNFKAQELNEEELMQVAGGATEEEQQLRSKTYRHGIIKDPENDGFEVGQRCGGTIRFSASYLGYECNRCGESWRVFANTDSCVLFSGNYFNLEQ